MSVRCALLQAAIGEVFPEATISVLLSSDVLDCYTWAEYSPTLDEVAMQQRVGLAHCMSSLKGEAREGALLKGVCVCVRAFCCCKVEAALDNGAVDEEEARRRAYRRTCNADLSCMPLVLEHVRRWRQPELPLAAPSAVQPVSPLASLPASSFSWELRQVH